MKLMKHFGVLLLGVVAALSLSSCACERIDAGSEGILVNLVGDSKGVDENITLVTGWQVYNPITKAVYEYPTSIQTVDYPEFELNSKDGSKFTVDPTILIKLHSGKAATVFVRYRREMHDVITNVLEQYVRNCYRIELNKYTANELISNREEFESSLEARLRTVLNEENFELIEITSGLQYPKSLVDAIDAKNKAAQEELRVQNEVLVAKAEAEKLLVSAKAEAEANRLRTQALTPQVLEKMWIEKWNGVLPVYGQVPTLFRDISK